jgi:hypothetical protein
MPAIIIVLDVGDTPAAHAITLKLHRGNQGDNFILKAAP